MNTVLDLSAGERIELFTQAGVELGLPAFYVEKDFWVCWVLEVLFLSEQIGPHLGMWRRDYRDMEDMFINASPEFDELIESVQQIEQELRAGR